MPGRSVFFFFNFQGYMVYVARSARHLQSRDFWRLQARRCNVKSSNFVNDEHHSRISVFGCGGRVGRTGRPHVALKILRGTSTMKIRIGERHELPVSKLES